jgi:hypothetical protein
MLRQLKGYELQRSLETLEEEVVVASSDETLGNVRVTGVPDFTRPSHLLERRQV